MSVGNAKPWPVASLIRASVSPGSWPGRWFTATVAPSAASRAAVACPIPVAAPVTSATLPSKRRSMWPPSRASEDRNRVPRRAGATRQAEGQADDHELEPPFFRAGQREVFQLKAVRHKHPHRGDLKRMDGVEHALDVARHRFTVTVGKERGNLALVHPANRVDVQAGLPLTGRRVAVVPGAELEAAPVVAGAEDEDVAFTQPHVLGLLDGLKFCARDGFARLEPADTAVPRHVQQHSPAHQAVTV